MHLCQTWQTWTYVRRRILLTLKVRGRDKMAIYTNIIVRCNFLISFSHRDAGLNTWNHHCGSCTVPDQTYVATALRPVCDWQFPPIAEVATRSPIGPGEVEDKSATSRGPHCDQNSRSYVFEHVQKPGSDWCGRWQVPTKSPTSLRSVADRSPTNFVRIGACYHWN